MPTDDAVTNDWAGGEPAAGERAGEETTRCVISHLGPSPDLRVLSVRGELDISTASLLQRELDGLLSAGTPRVEVDLSGVVFMDSSALSALVTAHERAGARGQKFSLVSPSPACAKVLGITGLDRVFNLL